MNENELRQAIALGREQRGREFKGPGKRSDKAFLAKVIRAILGMANKPGGGVVIVGVVDDGAELHARGLSAPELKTWTYDDLASKVSTYADPYVDFDIEAVSLDGNAFVVIDVHQFDKLPVICKRDYPDVLRNGALYVRRRGKNETIEVPSHNEMREVIERAAEILARDMVRAHTTLLTHQHSDSNRSFEDFDEEARDLL